MPPKSYYVYILHCSDGFYYSGITNNLNRRLLQHEVGINPFCYTHKRRPVTLKWYEEYFDVLQAISREKQIKGWSGAKKEALFREDFDALKELAKCGERKAIEEEEAYRLRYDAWVGG